MILWYQLAVEEQHQALQLLITWPVQKSSESSNLFFVQAKHCWYSGIPITRTPSNSEQAWFPLDFFHTIAVILSSVIQTPNNSNLLLSRTFFNFPWRFELSVFHCSSLHGYCFRCHAVTVCDDAKYFYEQVDKDLHAAGLDAKAESLLDIIDGYKGKGYALSTDDELGEFTFL